MYLAEWGFWQMATESEYARKAYEAEMTPAERRSSQDYYEGDLEEEIHFQQVSDKPHTRGPIFAFNERFLEMRCGGSEDKRGLITLITLGGILPGIIVGIVIAVGSIWLDITRPGPNSFLGVVLTIVLGLVSGAALYFYSKYGIKISRFEILTSRHLLIRFNRLTQQVHLHRPSYCGGIVTFPWKTTGSTGLDPADDSLSVGMRLG
ncbi:hypothetical protein MBA34_27405, partial [Pseudomonas capeferrum]|nr:hypothetical protein [Pseudomonas capeferrum]